MQQILDKVEQLKKEIEETQVVNAEQLEKFRIRFLGTKGLVKELMGEMKNVSKEMKKDFGAKLNEFKVFAEDRYEVFKGVGKPSEVKEENLFMSVSRNRS